MSRYLLSLLRRAWSYLENLSKEITHNLLLPMHLQFHGGVKKCQIYHRLVSKKTHLDDREQAQPQAERLVASQGLNCQVKEYHYRGVKKIRLLAKASKEHIYHPQTHQKVAGRVVRQKAQQVPNQKLLRQPRKMSRSGLPYLSCAQRGTFQIHIHDVAGS